MNNIFFSSDFHYNHKNIVRGCTNWEIGNNGQRCRNFNTLEEHDQTLLNNINNTIKENDTLYFLGDFCFNGVDNIWNFRKQIKCKNIHLIFGNHDHHIVNNRVLPNCIYDSAKTRSIIIDGDIKTQKEDDYSHYEYTTNEVRARELFTSVDYKKFVRIDGQLIVMNHFSERVWEQSHKGAIMLYGHSHGTLPGIGKSMDVGVDAHPEFRPFSWEEIKQIMDKRETLFVDHHQETTN